MPLNLFYTMVQKSQKWPKTQIKGGSCLKLNQMNYTWSVANTCLEIFRIMNVFYKKHIDGERKVRSEREREWEREKGRGREWERIVLL